MKLRTKTFSLYISIVLLSACGGGGGSTSTNPNSPDNSTGTPTPTSSQIIANSKDYTPTELQNVAKKLADERYIGLKGDAEVNLAMVQQLFVYLFNDISTEIPTVADQNFTGQMDNNGNVDIDFNCYAGGNAVYKGKVTEDLLGNISISYNNCGVLGNDFAITGSMAVTISQLTEYKVKLLYYFDELSWQVNGQSIKLTGYSIITSEESPVRETQISNEQYVLFDYNNQQQPLLLDATIDINPSNSNLRLQTSGTLFMGDAGKVNFSLDEASNFPPLNNNGSFLVSGQNSALVEFEDVVVRYLEDTDADGNFDMGSFFSDAIAFLDVENGSTTLTAIADLSYPPIVETPSKIDDGLFNTTTELIVRRGRISDRDNALEDLQVSYKWYINGEVVSNQTSNRLPPNLAVYGDSVKVSMVVSDGFSQVEGPSISIEIEDAPAQIETVNLPEDINPGDVVQFLVKVTDPDVDSVDALAKLVSGPSGALIDEKGLVTWNVPTDFLFPFQYFEFGFAITGSDGVVSNTVTVPLEVSSNTQFPIAASGLEIPKFNNSMAIGDFDGDGKNEILSTDSRNSVFLLESAGNQYKHKWFYPFKMPSDGQIVQVLSADIENDDTQEILVITEYGVSVINGLDSKANLLFSTTFEMKFASIADFDADGTPELAYLYSDVYSHNWRDYYLNVVSLDNPNQSLFNAKLSGARSLELANVDEDPSLELITNNGFVFDTVTWEQQWDSDAEFGDALVSTGDFNGDGIAEIARAENNGKVVIYSAIDKTQLGFIGNLSFCTLSSADLDGDGSDELLTGNCDSGNVTSFKLGSEKLTKFWQVNIDGSSPISLSTGDSDNDGKIELHWGAKGNNNQEDIFASADVNSDGIKRKPESLSIQLDEYSSAGWANVSDNQERAVFFIPTTESGNGGSRIATVNENGNYELSSEISSSWNANNYAVATDFNNDGFGDIFLHSDRWSSDYAFSAIQLSDTSLHWQVPSSNYTEARLIKTADINADGYDDSIYIDESELKILDVENQTSIANISFESPISDFAAIRLQDAAALIVAFNQKLSFLKSIGSEFSQQSMLEQSCERLALFNYDNDAQLELLCLQPTNDEVGVQQLVVFELNNFSLEEVARNNVSDTIIDIVADPSKQTEQNLLMTTLKGEIELYKGNYNVQMGFYHIKKSNSKGNVIWSSPGLVGRPSAHGLKVRYMQDKGLEIMLSTGHMMYWIK